MKTIFPAIALALTLFSCTGIKEKKKEKNSLEQSNLKGKVKSVAQAEYTATDSAGQVLKGPLYETKHWVFDKKGYLTSRHFHYKSDSIGDYIFCKYDSNEHLVSDSGKEYIGTFWTNFLFDGNGNCIERDQNYSDNGKPKRGITTLYTVDKNGNPIEEDCYWGKKDSLNYKAHIKYNDMGQETENAKFDNKDRLVIKEVRIYDEKGYEVEYQRFDKHDSLETKTVFKNDSLGKDIESTTFKGDGKMQSKLTRKYDDKGNNIETIFYKADGTVESSITCKFENFDKEGNWLREVYMSDGKPNTIEERVIEYY